MDSSADEPLPRVPWTKRLLALFFISVLLHILALNWVRANMDMPLPAKESGPVITATLHPALPPPAVPAPETAPPAPKTKPAKPRRRPGIRTRLAVTPAKPSSAAVAISTPPEAAPGAGMEAAPALPAASLPPLSDSAANTAQEAAPASVHYKIALPPSGEVIYDVEKVTREGNPMYGHGKISWQSSGGNYVIDGEAGVLFITALSFKSEGTIDDFGVAPELYSEKRFRKSATNTHFHRERNTISFSASEASYPRKGGEQDRASIIWQLAAIGRGGEQFAPDADIDIFVAGVRDGETWRIHVIGQEDIKAGAGQMRTWHVARVPRPGSYDQKLDIWLAPQHEWYPVKLRYTETNGDYLDMSLSTLHIAAGQ